MVLKKGVKVEGKLYLQHLVSFELWTEAVPLPAISHQLDIRPCNFTVNMINVLENHCM